MFASAASTTVPSVLSQSHPGEKTFGEVLEQVAKQADLALPDQILSLSRLYATQDGYIEAPGFGRLVLTQWSRRQLAAILGIRWDKWFAEELVAPADRAQEINLRFRRSSETRKIRARRFAADESALGRGVLRAFVSPTYAPMDDMQIMETLGRVLGSQVDELRFVRLDLTDESSQYAAVNIEDVDLGLGKVDRHRSGFVLANSEVGSRALSVFAWIWRLVCTNGLVARTSKAFRMVHRRRKGELVASRLAEAVKELSTDWRQAETLIRDSQREVIGNPREALTAVVERNPHLRSISQAILSAYDLEPDGTRFGIVQALTRAAQRFRPEERLMIEQIAGDVVAGMPLPEVVS